MDLVCEFRYWNWLEIGSKYTSTISSSSIQEPNTIIQKINGKHLDGKSDKDVESIYFMSTTVNYFPRGLDKIFPNLKEVDIFKCGLKSVTRGDLDGLENIEVLSCDSNEITSLPGNLFRNMTKLVAISFAHNDLHCMSSELLMPLLKNGLKFVDFRRNRSIDAVYCDSSYTQKINGNKVDSLVQLMAMIFEKCDKPNKKDEQTLSNKKLQDIKTEGFNELWTTGRFSDITIVTDTEKFKAHKAILSVQSSVFTSIFENEMKDRPSDEIQMKNINPAVVKIFLKFLYTNEIEEQEQEEKQKEKKGIEVSLFLELFALAAKFKVQNLMTITEEMIIDNLNVNNAMDVFELACLFNCDKMKTSAFEVIRSMFDKPLKDELLNQPENIKKLIDIKKNFDSMLNMFSKQ